MSEELHTKLRLELIIETPAVRRAETVLKEAGATGWTITPAISGQGRTNRWSIGTDISGASDMVVLICVGDENVLKPALSRLHDLLGRHIGVLNLSEVSVLRPGRF